MKKGQANTAVSFFVGYLVWFYHDMTLIYYTIVTQTVEFRLSHVADMAFFQIF